MMTRYYRSFTWSFNPWSSGYTATQLQHRFACAMEYYVHDYHCTGR